MMQSNDLPRILGNIERNKAAHDYLQRKELERTETFLSRVKQGLLISAIMGVVLLWAIEAQPAAKVSHEVVQAQITEIDF